MALPYSVTSDMVPKGLSEDFDKQRRGDTWFPGWKPSWKKDKNMERGQSSQAKSQDRNVGRDTDDDKQFLKDLIQKQEQQIQEFQIQIAKLVAEVSTLRTQLSNGSGALPSSADVPFEGKTKSGAQSDGPKPTSSGEDGWSVVRQKRDKREQTPIRGVGLQLRSEDWNVPVVTVSAFRDGANGIALTTQREGEDAYNEMIFCKGSMGVLTPKPIPAAESQEVEVLVRRANGQTDTVKKYLTNVGDTPIQCDSAADVDACTLRMENKTKKLMLQIHKDYATEQLYAAAKQVPKVAVDKWLANVGLRDGTLNIGSPYIRKTGDSEWVETVLVVRDLLMGQFLTYSGKEGVFIAPYYDKDNLDDGTLKKIMFEKGTTLDQALSRAARHANLTVGLCVNARGLGVRVNALHYKDMVTKILSAPAAAAVLQRDGQKFYQMTKVPPWVDFGDLRATLRDQCKWEVELVRTWTRYGSKAFIVRASYPPPLDVFIIEHHKVPVQLAPDRPRPQVQVLQRQRIAQPSAGGPGTRSAWADKPKQQVDMPKQHVPRNDTDMNIQNELRQMKELMQSMMEHMRDVDQRTQNQKDHLEYLSRRVCYEEDDISNFEDTDILDVADSEDDMMVQPQSAQKTKRKKKTAPGKVKH